MSDVQLFRGLVVTGVVVPAGPVPKVNCGSGAVNLAVVDCPGWYAPVVGDVVNVMVVDGWASVVLCTSRPGVVSPSVPRFVVANAAPSDADQIDGTFAAPTNTTPPQTVTFVRSTPVPAPTAGTSYVPAASSGTYDDVNRWDSRSSQVRQGSVGSVTNAFGCWFHPGLAGAAVLSTVTGMSVTAVRTRGGDGGPVNLRLFLHTLTARPGTNDPRPTVVDGPRDQGANATIGAPCLIPIPQDWWSRLLAGGYGVGITGGDYAVVLGPDASPLDGAGRPLSGLISIAHS